MSRRSRVGLGIALLAGGLILLSVLTRPPLRLALNAAPPEGLTLARGAFHVHTLRSDGTGSLEDVARAASLSGLDFVLITDHGDGTRRPEPPAYRSGVLCIDAVELSTSQGHYAALGLAVSPYPLRGDPDAVVEDVRRAGAFGVVTHPESPKGELSWRDWTAPVGGLEWVNADSEWRDERVWTLAAVLWRYPWRPTETLTGIIDDTARALARWDQLTSHRRVVAIAAVDAHGGMAVESPEEAQGEYRAKPLLRIPSYTALFRLLDNTVLLERPLTGEAGHDASLVLEAVRRGRLCSTIGGVAGPGWVVLSAVSGGHRVYMGDSIGPAGPIHVEVETNAPEGCRVVLKRSGVIVSGGVGPRLEYDDPGGRFALRAEVWLNGAPSTARTPWGVTNPIYAGYPPEESGGVAPRWTVASDHADAVVPTEPLGGANAAGEWHSESDPTSRVAWSADRGGESRSIRIEIALGPGRRPGAPYGALAIPLERGSLAATDEIQFNASADRPCRLSIQLRASDKSRDRRWRRSVYLDEVARLVRMPVAALRSVPAGESAPSAADLAEVDSLLLVLDTVNLHAGQQRTIRITTPARLRTGTVRSGR